MRIEVPSPSGSCPPTPTLGHSLRSDTSSEGYAPHSALPHHYPASSSGGSSSAESRIRPLGTPKEDRSEVQPLKFKTQLCSYYVRGESCPYAPWCAFAHGVEEKRTKKGNAQNGVQSVNTLPRTMVYHESWVHTTKYTRKTGPAMAPAAAQNVPPPTPSFMRPKKPQTRYQHNPYSPVL